MEFPILRRACLGNLSDNFILLFSPSEFYIELNRCVTIGFFQTFWSLDGYFEKKVNFSTEVLVRLRMRLMT